MLDTSGLLLTENKDGSIRVEYVDYDTPMGGDFESMYDLNKVNADKLRKILKEKYPKYSLKKALVQEVGQNFSDRLFVRLLRENNIDYDHSTWLS